MIPIPGTKKRRYLVENVSAIDVELSESELDLIERIVERHPNIGARYSEGAWRLVNN
jgi:aryl-alcohol dehydrogenase-like predicted oxidoreductase